MEVKNSDMMRGSLQISTDVIAKISRLAALEIEGVKAVSCGNSPVKGLFAKVNIRKPVEVELSDEVAQITVSIVAQYGYRISVGLRSACQKCEGGSTEYDWNHRGQGQRCGHRCRSCAGGKRRRRRGKVKKRKRPCAAVF